MELGIDASHGHSLLVRLQIGYVSLSMAQNKATFCVLSAHAQLILFDTCS